MCKLLPYRNIKSYIDYNSCITEGNRGISLGFLYDITHSESQKKKVLQEIYELTTKYTFSSKLYFTLQRFLYALFSKERTKV